MGLSIHVQLAAGYLLGEMGVRGSLTSVFGLAGTWGATTVPPFGEGVPSYSTAVTLPLKSFMVHVTRHRRYPALPWKSRYRQRQRLPQLFYWRLEIHKQKLL